MANIQKIREVPDSEDELLSSSPVDITTVAPDKLFTAVPLSHQDVQDAPLRDPYCHQDSAEPIANDADTNTDGLGDGHEKASLHVGSPQDADPSSSHKAPPATSVNTGSPDMHLSPCYMAPEAALTSSSASGATSAVFVTDTPQTYAEPGPRENVQPATQDIQSSSKPKVSVSDDNYQDAHSRQAICDTEHFKTVFKDRTRPTDKACNEHNDNVSCTVSIAQVPAPTNLCYARNAPVRTTSEQFYNQHPEMSSLIGAHAEAHTVRSTRSSSLPLEDDRANMIAAELLDTSKIPCSIKTSHASSTTAPCVQRISEDTGIVHDQPHTLAHAASQTSLPDIAATVMAEEPTEAERDAISPETVSPMKEVIDTTAPDVLEPAVTSKQPNVGTNQADPSVPPEPISQAAMQPSQPKTQQEITLAELKAQKAALLTSLANLPAIQVLVEEHASSQAGEMVDEEATEKDIFTAANRIVKDHIKLLHEYNELKDVGQGLMGLIADQRGVRIVEVQDEFGIEGQD